MSKKDLVVKEAAEITVSDMVLDWGEAPQLSANDLVIPRILPQQGMSHLVTEGRAKFGDFCNSISGDVLGSITKPMAFIPFFMFKFWAISKKVNGKMEFNSIEPCTPANENLFWEFQVDGVEHVRQLNRAFYVMVEGQPLPMILSFKGMSSKAGKVLATQMYTVNAVNKLPPPGMVMNLIGKKEQNDKGTFITLDVQTNRPATHDEIMNCKKWFDVVKTTQVKHDDSDLTNTNVDLKVDQGF